MIEDMIPVMRRVGPDTWRDGRTGQIYTVGEIIEKYEEILPLRMQHRQQPKWLREIQQK
jgi:hypothetical protein